MRNFFCRMVTVYLVFAFLIIGALPVKSFAYIADSATVTDLRGADMDKVQRALESKVVANRLLELGLSEEEVSERLAQLTDEELHQFASKVDDLSSGGSFLGVTIGILVVGVLVLVLLQLTGHKIVLLNSN